MEYKLVSPSTENWAIPRVGAAESWVCDGPPTGWKHPTAGVTSVDAHLFEPVYSRGPLNIVYRLRVGIIRTDLLEAFGAELVSTSFALGNVYGPNGVLIPNWKTFRGKHRIVVRGTKNAAWQRCEACGAIQYSSWVGRDFLWPAPDPDVPVFDDNGCLVFRSDIAAAVFQRNWLGVRIRSVRVAKELLDGIAELGTVTAPFG